MYWDEEFECTFLGYYYITDFDYVYFIDYSDDYTDLHNIFDFDDDLEDKTILFIYNIPTDFFYPYERGPEPNENVWIYPYNQQAILLPLDYYENIPIYDLPPNGFTPLFMVDENCIIITNIFTDVAPDPMPFMEIVPDFIIDRYSLFFPEDRDACLRIIEALLPLQIPTAYAPGFFEYVKHPVILGNIKHRIINDKYTRLRDVIHDLRAIVWNMNLYLSNQWQNWIKESNDRFSAVLEDQLRFYYPENPFAEITGDHDHKPI
ncbi:hypothetical protein CBL_13132 [Carabus blaptoides fortunei]